MLSYLYEYAKRTGIGEDIYNQTTLAPWIIDIDPKGKILGYVSTREKIEGKELIKEFSVPAQIKPRSSGISPRFLVDKFEYTFGIGDAKKISEKYLKRLKAMNEAFILMLSEAEKETNSKDIGSMLDALRIIVSDPSKLFRTSTDDNTVQGISFDGKVIDFPKEWKHTDNVVFRIQEESTNRFVHLDKSLHRYWKDKVEEYFQTLPKGMCLISGEEQPLTDVHPQIGGLKEAQSTGAPLISFNNEIFESFGFSGNENSQVGIRQSKVVTNVVQYLIREKNHHFILPSNTTALFWHEGNNGSSLSFRDIIEGDTEEIKSLMLSPYTGSAPESLSPNFVMLLIKGANGRIAIKDFIYKKFEDIVKNVADFHRETAIIGSDYPLKIWDIVDVSFSLKKKDKKVSGGLGNHIDDLYMSIVNGKPLPRIFAQKLLERAIQLLTSSSIEKKSEVNRGLRVAASYLRCFINRTVNPKTFSIGDHMEEDNRNPGYLMGRLLAVADRIRYISTKSSSLPSGKYLRAFSSRPQVVLPVILENVNFHIKKCRLIKEDKIIQEILSKVGELPARFSEEQKSSFFLGFYHQRLEFFSKKQDS